MKDQSAVDGFLNKLDGPENKTKLGANAILGVSMGEYHHIGNYGHGC